MICKTCADAADGRLPRQAHCGATPGPSSACDCQHRVPEALPDPDGPEGCTDDPCTCGQVR